MSQQTGHPWDRQDGEPAEWYARFDQFRLLGIGRSIYSAYRASGGTKRHPGGAWARIADKWEWTRRAEAWDAAERSDRLDKLAEADQTARKQHLQISEGALQKAVEALKTLPTEGMSPSDIVRLADWAIQLRRDCLATPVLDALRERVASLERLLTEQRE